MINRFMMSVAAVALIAGTGFANAQGTGTGRDTPSAGSTVQQGAPSSERGNSAAPTNRDAVEPNGVKPGMKATQTEPKPGAAKKGQSAEDKALPGQKSQSAEDKALPGQKSKSMSSENDNTKGGKDLKAEGREGRDRNNMNAEGREGRDRNNMNAEQKGATDRTDSKSQTTTQSQTNQPQTTGQAGAGAKLSSEQRTKITTVIRSQRVEPLNNVNFSISVGTRVPHDVRFYPLPAEVVTIYPQWRGYEYVLVRDQILVIDPRTFEIVAVLDV
jgi:hypothetical protein